MKKEEWPTKEQIDESISHIIDFGIKKRPKSGNHINAIELLQRIGLKGLFPNRLTIIVIICVSAALYGLAVYQSNSEIQLIRMVFAFSPLTFMCVILAGEEYLRKSNMNETEMICCFNLYRLTAVRMFLISLISILINTSIIFPLYLVNCETNVFYIAAISNSSLFLVSLCMVVYLAGRKHEKMILFFPVLWIAVNGFLSGTEIYSSLIINGSQILHWIIAIVTAIIYLQQLKSFTKRSYGEEGKIVC